MWARGTALEPQRSHQAHSPLLTVPPRMVCPVPGEDKAMCLPMAAGQVRDCLLGLPVTPPGARTCSDETVGPGKVQNARKGLLLLVPGGPSGGVCRRRGLEKDVEPGILSSVSPPSGRLGRGQNEISRCAVAKRRAFFTFPCIVYLFPLFPPVLSFWAENPVSTNLRTFGQSSVWHDTAVISYLWRDETRGMRMDVWSVAWGSAPQTLPRRPQSRGSWGAS